MAVCPVCFANNAQGDTVCSECGTDLSLSPDAKQNFLPAGESPFFSSGSPRIAGEVKPLLCKACGAENPSNARFCVMCSQSIHQTVMPKKKRNKFVYLLVAAAIIFHVVVLSVIFKGISSFVDIFYYEATYLYVTDASLPEADYMEASYDDYSKKPDGVMGDDIRVTGTVTQIEKEYDKFDDFLTIYLSEDYKGERIWMIGYHLKDNETIEVGDMLTFYGTSHGLVRRQNEKTTEVLYVPVIRASVFSKDDPISGKTWAQEDSAFMFTLLDDGTCKVVVGKGTEDEYTDTGTYSVYRGRAAIKYITLEIDELGLTQEELFSGFELQDNLDDFYCLALFRDKDVEESDSGESVPSIVYLGIYSEESGVGTMSMISSSSLSFVVLTEVTD